MTTKTTTTIEATWQSVFVGHAADERGKKMVKEKKDVKFESRVEIRRLQRVDETAHERARTSARLKATRTLVFARKLINNTCTIGYRIYS